MVTDTPPQLSADAAPDPALFRPACGPQSAAGPAQQHQTDRKRKDTPSRSGARNAPLYTHTHSPTHTHTHTHTHTYETHTQPHTHTHTQTHTHTHTHTHTKHSLRHITHTHT